MSIKCNLEQYFCYMNIIESVHFFFLKKLLKCFIALFCSMFGKTKTVAITVAITVLLKPGGQNHPRSLSISQCQALNETPVRYSQDSNCSVGKMVDCDQLKFGLPTCDNILAVYR